MALTVGTAIKALLEASSPSLGVPIHAELPQGEKPPYVLIQGPIANPRDRAGAPAAGAPKLVLTEMQVDVFQPRLSAEDSGGKRDRAEDPLLAELVAAALDGAGFDKIPNFQSPPSVRLYGCELVNGPRRIPASKQTNLVHHVIQVRVRRTLTTARA